MHVHLFWTYSGSKLSKLVRRAEGGPWTHCGVLFVDEQGTRYGFEARSREGWTGPYDFTETQRYVQRMGGQMELTPPLPFTPHEAAMAYDTACSLRTTSKPYAWGQLAWIWLARRYKVTVPRSPDKLICSEGAAKVVASKGRFPAWKNADAITPMKLWNWYCESVARSHRLAFGDYVASTTGVEL